MELNEKVGQQKDQGNEGAVVGKTEAQKRRQQVYQAQKRHRDRKAEYVDDLEKEIARLRRLGTETQSEKQAIVQQNREIKELLTQHSIDGQLSPMDSGAADTTPSRASDAFLNSGATLNVRFDPLISQERTFLDFETRYPSQAVTGTTTVDTSTGAQHVVDNSAPSEDDTAAALDFILALEWPCQGHSAHSGIQTDHASCVGFATIAAGHALSATNAVFNSALPVVQDSSSQSPAEMHGATPQEASPQQKWHLPYSEIEKLVKLSENLPLDDEQLTPAQAYSAIHSSIPHEAWLRPVLDAMRLPLSSLTYCGGFGTVLPANEFWQLLDATMETLRDTRADLPLA